jgi:hypothetical protein
MGCRVISAHMGAIAVMYCSTTDWAFGPVFYDNTEHSADERIESFMRWLVIDPRSLPERDLESKYSEWRLQEKEQWKKEETEQWEREEAG